MKLNELYTSILSAAGLVVDEKGFVSVNNQLFTESTKNDPVLVDGKRLVLPTHEHLTDPNKQSKLIFHPLSENILRGESVVVAKLRSLYTVRLNFAIAGIVTGLLDICASINKHRKLNPDQAGVLSVAPNCDEGTVDVFHSLLHKVFSDEITFVKFYLRRSGIIKGVKYSRAGIVTFPFFEALVEAKDSLCGVKLRKKDKEAIQAIFEFILPGIGENEHYNRGSDSMIAPFLDALMKTFMGIAGALNDIIELYKDQIEDIEKLTFDSDWVEAFDNLEGMMSEIRKVPVQAGNEGEAKRSDVQPVTPNQNLQYTPPPPAGYQPLTPVNVPANTIPQHTQTQSSAPAETGKVKLSDLMNRGNVMPVNAPIPPSLAPEMMQQMNPQMNPQMMNQQMAQAMMAQQMMRNPAMYPQQMMPGMVPVMMPGMMPGMMYPQQVGYPMQQQVIQPGMPRSAASVMPNNPVNPMNQMGMPGMMPGMQRSF